MTALAIDFGTSNSAAAVLDDSGAIRRIALEPGADVLPTAVFFPARGGTMQIGSQAARALVAGDDGRYMRALKSVLGTALFHESRLVGGTRRTLADIVTAFLAEVKARAETATGTRFDHALSGRPVRFHSADATRDAQAAADLTACYRAAGFQSVRFLFEPEAAALASARSAPASGSGQPGLIVDIGGGTSDFTVFTPAAGGIEVLASHGIRLGGTDFDQAISLAQAMPLLGLGGQLRRAFGDGFLPVPTGIYAELSNWAKIPFLYAPETGRAVADLLRHAVDPDRIARLDTVIRDQLGHELAFAVEAGKIEVNTGNPRAAIAMAMIEPGLSAPLSPGALNAALSPAREALRHALYETLFKAGLPPDRIGKVVLVGGSSLLAMVADEARALCPQARLERSEAFTAVIDGLALATALPG